MADRYTPNGDGTYHGVPACEKCGTNSFLFLDDERGPECLTCFTSLERQEVRIVHGYGDHR